MKKWRYHLLIKRAGKIIHRLTADAYTKTLSLKDILWCNGSRFEEMEVCEGDVYMIEKIEPINRCEAEE